MKAETWVRIRTLFEHALALQPAEQPAFLEESCADDPETKVEVRRLLALDRTSAETFDRASVLRAALWSPGPGTRIGEFTIVRAIGSGGMGTVYEAIQDHPRRTVALKTLRVGLASTARVQRFRFEAEMLARLRHPAIAQVHAAGTHVEGGEHFPYVAMELVPGARDLVSFTRDEGLSLAARLELFAEVCSAVHHAHQKGVVHRDLKAENVLVDAEGRPKVIDFGVALCSELLGPRATEVGEIVGTLATMSPEQLAGDAGDVDARTDVYSLGVVLWELVTGEPPYDLAGLSLAQAVECVRATVPRPPAAIPRELRWVLQRALEKDPARRYPSASELGQDLRRFLAREPVAAGPPGVRYRLQKLASRHRLPLAALGAVLLALSLGLLRAEKSARAEARARGEAVREARRARTVSDTLEWILTSSSAERDGRAVTIETVLEAAGRMAGEVAVSEPAAGAALHKMVGASYTALFRPVEAERHLAEARAFARERLERDDPLAIEIEAAWAWFLLYARRAAEAADLARGLLPSAERILGRSDRQTIDIRGTLASACYHLVRFDEAEPLALENLRFQLESADARARAVPTLLLLSRIALGRGAPADVAEARRRAQEALDLCAELLPSDDFHAVGARQVLALVAAREGDLAEGSEFEAALGAGRPDLRESECAAIALLAQRAMEAAGNGDHEVAYTAFAGAREEADRSFGVASEVAVQMRSNLAWVCLELGRLDEARRWSEEALETSRRILPPSHRIALQVGATAALVLVRGGDPRAAEARFRDVLRAADEVGQPDDPFALDLLVALGEALAAAGDRPGLSALEAELRRRAPEDSRRAQRIAELVLELGTASATESGFPGG